MLPFFSALGEPRWSVGAGRSGVPRSGDGIGYKKYHFGQRLAPLFFVT